MGAQAMYLHDRLQLGRAVYFFEVQHGEEASRYINTCLHDCLKGQNGGNCIGLQTAGVCRARQQAHQEEAARAKAGEHSSRSDAQGLENEAEEINGKLKKLQAEHEKLSEREQADTQLIQARMQTFTSFEACVHEQLDEKHDAREIPLNSSRCLGLTHV